MSDKKTITVSITINLGNYENLRLEVSDVAETQEEAQELRHFLGEMLDGFGNNDATAKHAIDKYKERILADAKEEAEESDCISYSFDMSIPEESPAETFEPEIIDEPVSVLQPELPPVPAPAPELKPENPEFVCSKCGAPVDKVQHDVSLLFNRKVLCKNCMK